VLEYLPFGNLKEQHGQRNLSEVEVLTILEQGASALSYLHEQRPPIVHRDIKPENILVSSRSPLHIKLSDFGLAKASAYLETACGTVFYIAPEIARYYRRSSRGLKYTCAVDIWSLGVVIFKYGYGLPSVDCEWGLPWCQKIIEALDGWDSDSLVEILSDMLVMDPKRRLSAEECLQRALELKAPSRSAAPTPIPYGGQQHQIGESEPTVLGPTDVAFPTFRQDFRDSEIQRYIRSQVPHPVRQEDSLRSIRDSEIQRYIRSKNSRRSGAPAFEDDEDSLLSTRDTSSQVSIQSEARVRSVAPAIVQVDKRKRSTQRSATSSSSARRTKRTTAKSSRSHEEPGFAPDWQTDSNHAGYGEQNNSLAWDAFLPGIITENTGNSARGSVNVGQGAENAGYNGRAAMLSMSYGMGNLVEHDGQNSLERNAFAPGTSVDQGLANHGEHAENGWTDSYLRACLLRELHKEDHEP
jgi:serine/threonine protein kinase